jgi:hypothetical protein
VIGFATNTDAKGKDFSRHISNLNRSPHYTDIKYFRFNINLGDQAIGLPDYKRMEELKGFTEAYLAKAENQN